MIRVLYLCEFPTLLGGEHSLLTALRHCPWDQCSIQVAGPANGMLADALKNFGLPHLPVPAGGKKKPRQLIDQLANKPPDIVHANSLMMADLALELAQTWKVKSVAHIRDMMTLSEAKVDRLNQLDQVICVSHAVSDFLQMQGVRSENISVIYNAVDVPWLEHQSKLAMDSTGKKSAWPNATDNSLACIGQIALRKGQDLFLHAARLLENPQSHIKFLVVGQRYSQKPESQEYENQLHHQAEKPPPLWVEFLGHRNDVASIIRQSTGVVIPSRQEPLSRVLLECLALRKPIIATAVGGTPELHRRYPGPWMVEPDHPQAMADKMLRLLKDPQSFAPTADPAVWADFCRRFSPTQYWQSLGKLYQSLVCPAGPG